MIPLRNAIGGLGNILFKEAYLIGQMMEGNIPDLYVQDEKYFKKSALVIKERFGQNIGLTNNNAIHVRRGDYVHSNFHTDLCETDYYQRAVKQLGETDYLVFSDDITWCIDTFKLPGVNLTFVEEGDEIESFNMMASCKSIITANSSFSWWAAWLCPNPTKRIITPKENTWFVDGIIRTKVPSEWEQI